MKDARIFLGVGGGIAAYKAAELTSALVQRGAVVDVVMTAAAERFVSPLTFSSLTARPVYTSLWDAPERIPHIRLVREAQVCVVAPATANLIAKLANGLADDLLSTALLASRVPLIVAPAMNSAMYEHAATQENVATLAARGARVVEPESGFLAERESGIGRLATLERLLDAIELSLSAHGELRGRRVLITAGPTREAIDPVRFVSNPSTGAMGIALAEEAASRGADVTLVLGPTMLGCNGNVKTVHVTTANEMHAAALERACDADLIIACAAVSDWRPAERAPHKVKKTSGDINVRMVRNPDILLELAQRNPDAYLVGFAAETQDHEGNARQKLAGKKLDAIAVNDVSFGRGFGPGENRLRVLFADGGSSELGTARKTFLASALLDAIAPRLNGIRRATGN
ncbi:MAG: bifunctional phosphopantothenoylcysteine decarboxylase/phosphopantothenate--cysteine ligase CoaBC [Candidatus Meridianibacter frigidus]|nr:MAG: bifunctional phosphopantothenoylcysteine decarboxylase/phosphopantothenate--cysteine ligase CoaBC [Candidatus Eremiobacteraeota bacterium]